MATAARARLAWTAAAGLAGVVVVLWLLGSTQDTGLVVPGRLPPAAAAGVPPAPELPAPAEPRPLVEASAASESVETDAGAHAHAAAERPPPATLSVLVLDPGGRAAAGAEVVADRGQPRRQLTDAEGFARVQAEPGATLRVAARHSVHRLAAGSATLEGGPGRETSLTLRLGEALSVCVKVEMRDGQPVAGAELRFNERADGVVEGTLLGPRESRVLWDDSQHLDGWFQESGVTDGQGRCCVNGALPGGMRVKVRASGCVELPHYDFEVDADGGDLGVIVLDPAVRLGGVVEDAAGVVPDALVELIAYGYWRETTDAEGRFALDGQPSVPARVEVLVAHAERGHFFSPQMEFTDQPARVVLVPDLAVQLVLRDAQTREPVEGDARLELRLPSSAPLLWLRVGRESQRTGRVLEGRLDVAGLPCFLEELRFTVGDYDMVAVPMQALVEDLDGVLEFELTRAARLLVRVRDARTGHPVEHAQLVLGQLGKGPRGESLPNFASLQQARFDAEAGGYFVDEAELGLARFAEVSLSIMAKGYANSDSVPLGAAGVRSCPSTIDFHLEPE